MLFLVEAPTTEPVTLAEAKTQIGLFGNSQDAYVASLISAARGRAENICERAFVAATWEQRLPAFCEKVRLYRSPIESVVSVTFKIPQGGRDAVNPSNYELFGDSGFVSAVDGYTWPDGSEIRIRFVTEETECPKPVKQAILMMISDMYSNRDESVIGTIRADNPAVMNLLNPYRNGDMV